MNPQLRDIIIHGFRFLNHSLTPMGVANHLSYITYTPYRCPGKTVGAKNLLNQPCEKEIHKYNARKTTSYIVNICLNVMNNEVKL